MNDAIEFAESIGFKIDDNLRVHATAKDRGYISSQSVEALLLIQILEQLWKMNAELEAQGDER